MLRFSKISTKRTKRTILSGENLIVPDTPIWSSVSGTSGFINAEWQPVTTLREGGSILLGPITGYEFYWGTTEPSVDYGGTPTGTQSIGGTTYSRSQAVTAGTWWCSVVAINSAGNSEHAIPFEVIVP
jgi:hypothetical protein